MYIDKNNINYSKIVFVECTAEDKGGVKITFGEGAVRHIPREQEELLQAFVETYAAFVFVENNSTKPIFNTKLGREVEEARKTLVANELDRAQFAKQALGL